MAILDLRLYIRSERPHIYYYLSSPVYPALRYLPRHLVRNGSPPSTITLSRYISHGSRNNYQDDSLRMCPCMGDLGDTISTYNYSIVAVKQLDTFQVDFD